MRHGNDHRLSRGLLNPGLRHPGRQVPADRTGRRDRDDVPAPDVPPVDVPPVELPGVDLPSVDTAAPALRGILDDAARDVPGADGAAMTVLRTGTAEGPAPGHPHPEALVGGWGECDEGPCVDAMRARRTTTILLDDVGTETLGRWPRYAESAERIGARSVLSFVMAPPDAMPASVTFHSGRRAGLSERSRAVGSVFAMRAAIALYGARRAGRLIEAMQTREVIGQATGILMERFGLDDEQAYAMLLSSAQDTNTPLLQIATWLSAQGKPQVG